MKKLFLLISFFSMVSSPFAQQINIQLNTSLKIELLFPGGKEKAVIFSYDDGMIADRKLVKLMNAYGIKGTFHLDKGYYYFRNFEDRILLGGGRNLDFDGETTTDLSQTEKIQNHLEQLLKEVILPDQEFKIAHRWSGIMGIGSHKKPIVSQLSENVYCGVRLGGMGVAIGSLIGKELAELV